MGCHCTVILGRWLSVRAPNSPHLGVPLRPVITDSGPALEPFRNDKIAYVNRGGRGISDARGLSRRRPDSPGSIEERCFPTIPTHHHHRPPIPSRPPARPPVSPSLPTDRPLTAA